MGTGNSNLGIYLMHNDKEIHNKQEQADTFASTWKNIMMLNPPRDTEEVQQHYRLVYEKPRKHIPPSDRKLQHTTEKSPINQINYIS